MPIDASQSIAYNRNPKYEIDTTGITNENIALSSTDQAHFIRAHMESNKELIAQLKSNIELLFKASK